MLTLPTHTSHVLQPLNVTYFKPLKIALKKKKKSTMAKNNYLEPNKATLETWVDKALVKSMKKGT
jgi:hypothetical protein